MERTKDKELRLRKQKMKTMKGIAWTAKGGNDRQDILMDVFLHVFIILYLFN
jgi:hypothetical protein